MTDVLRNWRRVVGQRVRRLTPDEARAMLARISAEGATIFHPDIRAMTGGYNSQSINDYVMRKLAGQAGMIRKENA